MIELPCPHCGEALLARNDWTGRRVKCPSCGGKALVAPAGGAAGVSPAVGTEAATLPPRLPDGAGSAETAPLPPAGPELPWATESPTVPGYEVLSELGRGGMGVVYKALQTRLNRVVALKMILSGGHAGEADLARFKTEAEAIARLQHPNIVQIYEVGEYDGRPFFSLEFCGGGSLEKKLGGTPLRPKEAAALVEALARAMHVAHEQAVVHRDLKPANILLSFSRETPASAPEALAGVSRLNDCVPKVTDFGLAKKLDEVGQTATGAVMGTPSYMAPEQAGGKAQPVGPSADVYALGAILYECLTGRPPFKAATPLDTILQVISDEPVPPRQLQPRAPRDLETICLKCLRKDPKKRYPSAKALAADLRRFQAGEPIKARPVGRLERAAKWVRRNPTAAALVVTLLLGTAIATLLAVRAHQKAAEADEQAEAARTSARLANDRAYVSDLRLVARAWEENDLGLMQQLLDAQRPERGDGIDRRGFEWGYWWRLSHDPGLQTYQGHTYGVLGVAFSPDGGRVGSASWDGTVRVWDAASGRAERTLRGHTAIVQCVAFSPDGRRLASGGGTIGKPGEVKVWDLATGKEALTLPGHANIVFGVCFSPDGRRLASASEDGAVKVWDTATGRETLTLKDHKVGARCVAFSPDGQRLASGGAAVPVVHVWDLATGQVVHTLPGHAGGVQAVAFSPDGQRLVSAGDRVVKVWDAVAGKEVMSLHGRMDSVVSVALSPDGRRLAGCGSDFLKPGVVEVWDLESGREALILRGHSGPVLSVAFSPDGRRLLSGGGDRFKPGEVRLWDAVMGQEALSWRAHLAATVSLAFSPDGRLASCSPVDKTARVWDVATGQETLTLRGHSFQALAYSPDGHLLASGGEVRPPFGGPGEVILWDPATGQELRTLRGHTRMVQGLAFNPDGTRLATASQDQTVKLWDVATGQEVHTCQGHTGPVRDVVFGPDGKWLASASDDKTVRIWDAATGQEERVLRGHGGPVHGLALSPDGQCLASASVDGTLKLWEAATGKEERTLRGHGSQVQGVGFSPDGKRVASASADKTVRVWDAASGQETLTLRGHAGPVLRVAFSPDGKRLASAAFDGTIKVWKGGRPD